MSGLLGVKVGMSRFFTDDGITFPVSIIEVIPNKILQIKTLENDGYSSVQLTMGNKKVSRIKKPVFGHLSKFGVCSGDIIREFGLDFFNNKPVSGGVLSINDVFKEGDRVDIISVSKGKGFSGTVKRYNFKTQDASHGNSLSHRVPGSIGQNQTPGRVFKGKKMPGHMGNKRCTIKNLLLVQIDINRNLLFVKGSIPGCSGIKLEIRFSKKGKI
ncbi:50S ribosomal protein L3 [Candidatus Legionella polyplacis]|uniref:50S ribosomal protein L3 n=1 Tax=Candidatus Legionella polyplacis TaxID=2005262 RepID=UPI000C1EC5CD|nr:50S ribosomal protein L3 [Candidatus Legionella polyplacis]ATW02073.1 50S ribosomal protein L3 [Candidatus Legionella polyplacis]